MTGSGRTQTARVGTRVTESLALYPAFAGVLMIILLLLQKLTSDEQFSRTTEDC